VKKLRFLSRPEGAAARDHRPGQADWTRLALLTLLCLAAAGAAALMIGREREPPVMAAHRAFMARSAGPEASAPGLPDLRGFGFRLQHTESVAEGTYAGYRAAPGCRLGLWTGPQASPPRALPLGWRSALERRGADTVWLLADEGIAPQRFAAIASAVGRGALPPPDAADNTPCG